ncbi:MAG: hypothetical protein FJ284_08975 [Planctomycetes bacterium]|nr:hypothetical protein [Planctomycetota bacterium]
MLPPSQPRGRPLRATTRRTFTAGAIAVATMTPRLSSAQPAVATTSTGRPKATGALAAYADRPDRATHFEPLGHGGLPGGEWLTGRLVSERWRGVEWAHELSLVRPEQVAGGQMLLIIGGGTSDRLPRRGLTRPGGQVQKIAELAMRAGLPAAYLGQVPHQPMFDGLVEDALIAHTFVEFARTGDVTWPLLLPMVKAAVEGMTAASQTAHDRWGVDVEGFVLSGASKRGWTTWLSAAVDDRVGGLVPAVIDMLSLERHVALQRATFGGLSDQLADYAAQGMERLLGSPRGCDLVALVDPFSYRARIVQPKLIALGTNDPYWPLEACGLYADRLAGPRWLAYGPNESHTLARDRLASLVVAMGRHVAGLEPLPEMAWDETDDGVTVDCAADVARAVGWVAESPGRDFRDARWNVAHIDRAGDGWRLPLATPAAGWRAGLVELHFARGPATLRLSSGVRVVGAA